jgi:hypothetical protein
MSRNVHIHVAFECTFNDRVAALARKHLSLDYGGYEVVSFLNALAERSGTNQGRKGGVSLWGMIGNATDGDDFCDVLRPFWCDLLSDSDIDMPEEHVIVFIQDLQSTTAMVTAYEIGWDNPDSEGRELVINKHEQLPFSWTYCG